MKKVAMRADFPISSGTRIQSNRKHFSITN